MDGNGSTDNSLFSLDANGILKTATSFDYESNASTYSIRVQAKDEYNGTAEMNFSVSLENLFEDSGGNSSFVFWSSQVGGSSSVAGIHRINMDGSNKITLFDFDAYIASDPNYLYYSPFNQANIFRCKPDGSDSELLISADY